VREYDQNHFAGYYLEVEPALTSDTIIEISVHFPC